MTPRAIELEIEAIVLRGFERVNRDALVRALQEQLAALLAPPEAPRAWRDESRAEACGAPVSLPAARAGAALGRELAHAVHGAIAPDGRAAGGGRR